MAVPAVFANQKADGTTLAGSIRWGDFKIQYLGTTYTIPGGSTTLRWMWWRYNGGGANSYIEAGADIPVDLADDDIVILGNKSGVPFRIQSTQLLDGDLIVDGSIGAAAIAAGTITADKMAVKIATIDDLTAGFIMSGRIQVGQSFWSKAEGIVIPQPGGGTITLPADGVTPASITAHLIAKSLTIEGALNLQGANNKISGTVTLSNGVTRPTAPPSLSRSWPSVPAVDTTFLGPISYGAVQNLLTANEMVYVNAFFGAGIGVFDKVTGANGIGIGSNGRPWFDNFNPTGGITSLGSGSTGNYYVLGYDNNRSGNWYIYRLDSAFNKISEVQVSDSSGVPGRPVIGNDGLNVMWANPLNSTIDIYRKGPDLGAVLGGRRAGQAVTMPNLFASPLCFIGEDVYDYGSARIVVGVANGNFFYPHTPDVNSALLSRNDAEVWAPAGGGNVRGMAYTDGRFKAHDTDGRWSSYSKIRVASTISGSYTWYDGVGTVRETEESPAASFSVGARSWPVLESPPPPDNGVAGSGVDRANRVGVYMGIAAGTTAPTVRRRQTYLAVDGSTWVAERRWSADAVDAGNPTPPTTNGFIGAPTGSPGSIASADGLTSINGDGTMFAGKTPTAPTHVANKDYVDSKTRAASLTFSAGTGNVDRTVTFATAYPAGVVPTVIVSFGNSNIDWLTGCAVIGTTNTGFTLRTRNTFNTAISTEVKYIAMA